MRISEHKRDKGTDEWRKYIMRSLMIYLSPNVVWVFNSIMRWAGHVAHMGERRGVYRVLIGKPEGKRPLGRPRHRCISRKWDVGVRTRTS
jgi:hypothetical protein